MAICHEKHSPERHRGRSHLLVAFAGTPNSGKTTLFNRLTRARYKVGNYPGVTVEKRSAPMRAGELEFELVDLPGMYGFSSESQDEIVAREFCLRERPDLIVSVVDASNLERGLSLTIQWLELGFPVVLVLNMIDEAEKRGMHIRAERLSELLGVPVVPTVASKGVGTDRLLEQVIEVLMRSETPGRFELALDTPLEKEIVRLAGILKDRNGGASEFPPRWLACRLVEGDSTVSRALDLPNDPRLSEEVQKSTGRLEHLYGQPPALVLSRSRLDFARTLLHGVIEKTETAKESASDRIDKYLTSPLIGLPIFLAATYLVFEFAFKVGELPMQWIEVSVAWLSAVAASVLPDGWLQSLIVDGMLGGVGGVIVFLPNIVLLFVAIAFLEDCGYMVRGAAVMDRLMSRFGLHGKSFIPLMVGFGCNVPAIMAARTLENRRDRLITILVTPMMSCGARLPVYMLFISAFFVHGAPVLFSIYLLGVLMAVGSALIFRRTVLRGRRTPFILEMPPYRMPTLRSVLRHAWDRSWMYLKKAGTIILALSIVVWFLSSYPKPPADAPENVNALRYSVAGSVGSLIEPALEPIGMGDWKVGVALITGFAAKEVVVSSFATMYNVSESGERSAALRNALRADPLWNPLTAYALMVFVLLYVPCLPSMIVLKRETGSWKWVAFQIAYSTAVAWFAAFVVFQGGRLLGLGT